MSEQKTIGIVGLGLIGGSMGKDFMALGHHVVGFDANPIHVQKAIDLGLVHMRAEIPELAKQSDVVIVAIPVKEMGEVVREILDHISWNSVVVDTGSTKKKICDVVRSHSKRGRFVAGHPLAGTEFSGPNAAVTDLFKGKKNIICEEHLCDEDALDMAIHLLLSLGMQSIFMDATEHDKHMAYVSHLSHVSAFTLGTTVLEIEKDEKQIFNLASTGFESTVRLAKSSPYTWSNIFVENSENLVRALSAYILRLEEFKTAIEQKDEEKIKDLISEANDIKRVLTGLKYNIVKLS